DRLGLPLSDHHRRALAALGQDRTARAVGLALPLPPLRPTLGAGPVEEAGAAARPARAQPVEARRGAAHYDLRAGGRPVRGAASAAPAPAGAGAGWGVPPRV